MNTQGGRTLVTGGTGFFGRLLVRDLLTHTRLDITTASRGKPSKQSSSGPRVGLGGDTAWSEFNHASTRWLIFLAYCFVVVIAVWTLFLAIRGNQSGEAESLKIASEAYVIPVQD
jgi:Male sterility protein